MGEFDLLEILLTLTGFTLASVLTERFFIARRRSQELEAMRESFERAKQEDEERER